MKKLFNDAFTWEGVSTRKEFWLTQPIFVGIGFIFGFTGVIFFGNEYLYANGLHSWDVIMYLLTFFPATTIYKRRLNDAGWSGWWMLFPVLNLVVAGFFVTEETKDMIGQT